MVIKICKKHGALTENHARVRIRKRKDRNPCIERVCLICKRESSKRHADQPKIREKAKLRAREKRAARTPKQKLAARKRERTWERKASAELRDSYIRDLLTREGKRTGGRKGRYYRVKVITGDVPQELIEAKRAVVQLKREILRQRRDNQDL